MGWKKVGSGEIIDFKRDGKGTETVGKYLGFTPNAGQFKKADGSSASLYHLEINGKKVSGFGSSVLDSRMANIQVGTLIKIVYLGQEKGKNYPTPMHMYDVYESDGTDTEDVQETSASNSDIPF